MERLVDLRGNLIEMIIREVVRALTGGFLSGGIPAFDQLTDWALAIPGVATIVQIIKDATGIDLIAIFDGIDITNPGALVGAIGGMVQQVIDALLGGITGSNSSGNNLASLAVALFTAPLQAGTQILESIFAQLAGLQSQVTAGSTTLSDDFAVVGVTGWTNITGALAISSSGRYIQTSNLAAAYRTTGPSTDRHGAQIVTTAKMHGTTRIAISSDTTASNYAALEVVSGFDGDAARIVTGSSSTLSVIHKQTDFIGPARFADGTAFDFWYDNAANKYYVLRNGQPVMDWVDTGTLVTHGASKRKVMLVSNADDRNEAGFMGPAVKKVVVYDK
jgi:hypothetical protein